MSMKHIYLLFSTTKISLVMLLLTMSSQLYSQTVEVYIDSTRQMIRGFGAANIVDWYGPDLTIGDVETAYGTGEGTLGFNILRLRISPDPNGWDNGNQVETARRVVEKGGIVWAAPWNPPESMAVYVNESDGSPQRRVDPEKYGAYASHLESFNQFMADRGVPLYGISIQNEPDYADDWTEWSPEEIVEFINLHSDSISTRIIAPESFQFRSEYHEAILNDSIASSKTDIIGGHIYGGGTARIPLAQEKGKEVWMTEHYTSSDRSANIWPDALQVGTEIDEVMKAGWNAYVWWQIKRYYSPIHDGVDAGTDDFTDRATLGSITKRGWVMAQYARFIRSGDSRVHSTGPFGRGFIKVDVSSFIDTTQSKIVLVAVNDESSDKTINVNLNGGSTSSFDRYITSERQNVEQLEQIEIEGNYFTTTLPAKSITTFVSTDFIPVSHEAELKLLPDSYILHQNYPNPFNPSTQIHYQVPESGIISLKIYDLVGREIATLVEGLVPAGEHTAVFNATNLSSGVYLYRLEANNFVATKKMLLIK